MACALGVAVVLLYSVAVVDGDTYLHMPRGSNNRLNENTANRQTNNRVFDSQNNNKGGYNVGDKTDQQSGGDRNKQYQMSYFQSAPGATATQGSSLMPIEWTNQHGCGDNSPTRPIKLNCNVVMQFMCQPDNQGFTRDTIRDGTDRGRINYQNPPGNGPRGESSGRAARRKNAASTRKGMNEPFEWRDKCESRERNKGLFTADQKLKKDKATNTRQNPNGNRNGYECPEERDYYPYWHPTDWKDIAVLTEDIRWCKNFTTESFNVIARHECREKFSDGTEAHYSTANNEAACNAKGGTWRPVHNYLEKLNLPEAQCKARTDTVWGHAIYGDGTEECLVKLAAPDCQVAPYTRVNHLGNSEDMKASKYMWKLPNFPSNTPQRCILRLRYNISTEDYDPYSTDSLSNNDDDVIENNPKVNVGLDNGQRLQLALNTAQTGRTFQDRSHVFLIKPRTAAMGTKTIHSLSVRGKRGNIVQTYPAVEYDFVPNNLEVTKDDLVHIQWTGSNSHNNGGGNGNTDGQTGDDGEGRGGTDRSNIMTMTNRDKNFFMTMEDKRNIANNMKAVWAANQDDIPNGVGSLTKTDIAIQLATSGQFMCKDCYRGRDRRKRDATLTTGQGRWNRLLDNAPASFAGMVVQFEKADTHVIGCTRNNNFSNRSQKGKITVTDR